MALKLQVKKNNGELVFEKELQDGQFKMGRSLSCDIPIESSQVSKEHALLVIQGDKAAIIDTGSSNGIFVNGLMVKKQRITSKDKINIADFQIRLIENSFSEISVPLPPVREKKNRAEENKSDEKNLLNPQEKMLLFLDTKILLPFFSLVKKMDWRWIIAGILVISLVTSALLSVIPVLRWGQRIATQESLLRAHSMLIQTARENYRIIAKSQENTRLTTEMLENEKGILSAYIIDPKTNGVLAPSKHFNKTINDIPSLRAIKKIEEGKEENVSVYRDSESYIVAQPIYIYSSESSERKLEAIVLATYQIQSEIQSTFQPLVESSLFAIVMSLLAFFFLIKMFSRPVHLMYEQLDSALKGESTQVVCEAKFPELENLATQINFAISRIQSGSVGQTQPVAVDDIEKEENSFIQSVEEFGKITSDGVLLLDRDKKVRFVGKVLEDLIGLRSQYAKGQNITDACRDQSFAGTVVDLTEQVIKAFGEIQTATLDINGESRNIFAVGHKYSNSEIAFVLISVKMGAA